MQISYSNYHVMYFLIFESVVCLIFFSTYFILITCSWHQKTEPRILQFTDIKSCIKAREPFKTPFNTLLVFISYFKKQLKPCLFNLQTVYSTLNSWIGKFVDSFFDVTNICSRHRTTKFPNSESPIFTTKDLEKVAWFQYINCRVSRPTVWSSK